MQRFNKIFNRSVAAIISLVSLYCYIKAYRYLGYNYIRENIISIAVVYIAIYFMGFMFAVMISRDPIERNKLDYKRIHLKSIFFTFNFIPQNALMLFDWKYKQIYIIFLYVVMVVCFIIIAFSIYERRREIYDFFKLIKNELKSIKPKKEKGEKM